MLLLSQHFPVQQSLWNSYYTTVRVGVGKKWLIFFMTFTKEVDSAVAIFVVKNHQFNPTPITHLPDQIKHRHSSSASWLQFKEVQVWLPYIPIDAIPSFWVPLPFQLIKFLLLFTELQLPLARYHTFINFFRPTNNSGYHASQALCSAVCSYKRLWQ